MPTGSLWSLTTGSPWSLATGNTCSLTIGNHWFHLQEVPGPAHRKCLSSGWCYLQICHSVFFCAASSQECSFLEQLLEVLAPLWFRPGSVASGRHRRSEPQAPLTVLRGPNMMLGLNCVRHMQGEFLELFTILWDPALKAGLLARNFLNFCVSEKVLNFLFFSRVFWQDTEILC